MLVIVPVIFGAQVISPMNDGVSDEHHNFKNYIRNNIVAV